MAAGIGFILLQTVGEVGYWRLMRKDRDDQIADEKEQQRKIARFQSLTAEEQEEETSKELEKDIKAAQERKSWLQSREDYKQERLNRIMKLKEKPSAPLMEELDTKPSLNDIRQRKLIQKNPNAPQQEEVGDKQNYI